MSFTSLSIIVLAVMTLSIYLEIRKGYKKGLTKSLIHLAILLGCALFGTVVSVALASAIVPALAESMQASELYVSITAMFGDAPELFPIVMSMILSLLLYLPVFFVLLGVVSLFMKIVCKCAFGNREREAGEYMKEGEDLYLVRSRAIGACVGIISGFLVSIVLLMPIVETVKVSGEVVGIMSGFSGAQTAEESYNDGENASDEQISPDAESAVDISRYANDFSATVVDVCGGRMLFDMTTRVKMYGRTTYLNKEIDVIKSIDINEVKDIVSSISTVNRYDDGETEALLANVDQSLILKAVMLSSVRQASKTWLDGGSYMGVSKPSFGKNDLVDKFLDEILYVFSTSDFNTIDADIITVINLNKIFTERRRVYNSDSYEDIIFDLEDNGTAAAVRMELEKNPHMRSVSYAVDDLVMTLLTDELNNEMKYTAEAREELYRELADALNTSAGLTGSVRNSAITERAKECFSDYGTYIPEALYDKLSAVLVEEIAKDGESVSYEDVRDFFESFKSLNNKSDAAPEVSDGDGNAK